MDKMQIFEIIGYLGSLTCAISLSFSSAKKMRIYNCLGCLFFVIYGIPIGAWPMVIANGYIALLDAYYLIQLNHDTSRFTMDELGNIGETYFKKFYAFYEDDIRYYFPDVNYGMLESNETYIMFRDMIPVGIFSMIPNPEEGKAEVIMEYVTPKFRDLKFGSYLYTKRSHHFIDRKLYTLEAACHVPAHQAYLRRVGFVESGVNENNIPIFTRKLTNC